MFAHTHKPTEFKPGSGKPSPNGRFQLFAAESGRVVPILYGAAQPFAALAETVFHDVPIRSPARAVFETRLAPLHGFGLRRLAVRAANLTDTESVEYPRTTEWACELHAALPDIDGLVWMSRRFNSSRALVLFGDRVAARDLSVAEPAVPLFVGRGRDLVDRAANAAGIAVVR